MDDWESDWMTKEQVFTAMCQYLVDKGYAENMNNASEKISQRMAESMAGDEESTHMILLLMYYSARRWSEKKAA
jgi:mannitol/fructose-specific phosphotransferase system IIA component (Ntr-type)